MLFFPWNKYPYTDFHELNDSWILAVLKELINDVENFVSINAVKYADPIQWNITKQYEKNTIVIDPLTGTAYISVAPVPIGVQLNRPEYWTVVFDLSSFVVRAAKNFCPRYEAETTTSATMPISAGQWVVWGDTLYKANVNITPGDSYVVGGNIDEYTVEEAKNDILALIGDLNDLNTTDKSNLVNAINDVLSTLTNVAGDLNDLNTTDKSSLVNAINDVLSTLTNVAGDLNDLNTTDKSNLVNAINENYNSIETIENKLSDYITPDDFTGTDSQKLQAALDSLAGVGGTIVINRNYELDADITISHDSNAYDTNINIVGVGKENTIDFKTYKFISADTVNRRMGGIRFVNVHLTGTATAFETGHLIRLFFEGCTIDQFDYVFYSFETYGIQSVYVNGCYVRHIKTAFIYMRYDLYDVHINSSLFEYITRILDARTPRVFTFTNSLSEAPYNYDTLLDNTLFVIRGIYRAITIDGNYFESNKCILDLSGASNSLLAKLTFSNNGVWDNDHNDALGVLLPQSVSTGQIRLINNTFSFAGTGTPYSISVESTGHDLYGVYIYGCRSTDAQFYDPEYKLHDLAVYNPVGSFTRNVSLTDSGSAPLKMRVDGKMCQMSGAVTLGADLTADTVMITLDNNYDRPINRISFPAFTIGGSNVITDTLWFDLRPDGTIHNRSTLTNGTFLFFDLTWISK